MGAVFLVAAVVSAASVVVMATGKKKGISSQTLILLALGVLDFVSVALGVYFSPPALDAPFFGMAGTVSIVLLANLVPLGIMVLSNMESYSQRPDYADFRISRPAIITGIWFLLLVGRWIYGIPMVQTSHYANLIGSVEVDSDTKDFAPTDVKHIRMVSKEQAIWSGNKVLGSDGSIGSQFKPGNYSLQMVDKKLKWVAPLDFISFSRWQSASGIPGYIIVDAEDSLAPAALKIRDNDEKEFSFHYSPGAYFGQNLARHIWQSGRRQCVIADTHFEIDDQHQPHWVVTLTLPSLGFGADKIQEVLIVDPATGVIEGHAPESVPDWVDRVVPESLAVNNIRYWGTYTPGWWSAYWSGLGVKQPTGSDQGVAWLVYGKDGRAHWFTGMSSITQDQQGLISVVTMDSRSGKTREYAMPGINENAVILAANSAVSNFEGYHGTSAILYHINGENVWAVPILSSQHQFQSLALVRAQNGQTVVGATKQESVRALKNLLARSGNSIVPSEEVKSNLLEMTIDRFSADVKSGTSVYLIRALERSDKIFVAQSEISAEVPLLKAGDRIEIEFSDSNDETLVITKLKVLTWAK